MKEFTFITNELAERSAFIFGILANEPTDIDLADKNEETFKIVHINNSARRVHTHAEKRRGDAMYKKKMRERFNGVCDKFGCPISDQPYRWERYGHVKHDNRMYYAGRTKYVGRDSMSAKERRYLETVNTDVDDVSMSEIYNEIEAEENARLEEINAMRQVLNEELIDLKRESADIEYRIAIVKARLAKLQ